MAFLGTLMATLGVDTMGLHRAEMEMRKFETQMQASTARINAQLRTTGKSMQKVGKSMTKYMTLPLALIGGAAFKMSMDFEASMSKVIGLVGIAKEQVDAWGGKILKMAPQLGKAPKELADALFFITSAGIRGAEAMDVLTMSAKASVAGLGETKVVADLVTSAMNAYGIANLSAAKATDILAATVREGKAEADALASTMGMVLPLASEMSVRFDEVGASIAAMTRTGTSAATASMQLRQILASLKKPTKQAEAAFIGMKTSAAELRRTIKEKGLLAALMKIRQLTLKYGETVVGKVIPNIRAMSGFLDLMGKNMEDNVKIYKALENTTGALNKAFEAAASTAKHKWNVAIASGKTALTILGKTISEQLTPILVSLSKRIQNLIIWFEGLTEGQRALIVKIGGLLLVVGPLIKLFGFLTASILPMFVGGIMAVVKAFGILRLAMLANPLGAMLVGLTAIITAYVIWNRSIKNISASQKVLNDVATTANRSITSEKVAIEQLLRVASSEHTSKEEKKLAIEKINKISPEYLGYITQEMVKTGQARIAIDNYIDSLLQKATIEAAYNRLVAESEKRIDVVMKKEDRRITMWQAAGLNLQWLINKEKSYRREGELRGKSALAYNKQQMDIEKELAAIIDGTSKSNENLTKSYAGVVNQMKFVSEMDIKQIASLKTRIIKQIDLQKKYTINYAKELEERMRKDVELMALFAEEQTAAIKWSIDQRTDKIRKEILLEEASHATQLSNMEQFVKQMNKMIEGMGGIVTVGGIANILKEELSLIQAYIPIAKERSEVDRSNIEMIEAYERAMAGLKGLQIEGIAVDPKLLEQYANEIERLSNITIDPLSIEVGEIGEKFAKQLGILDELGKLPKRISGGFDLLAEKVKLGKTAITAFIGAGVKAGEALQKVDTIMQTYNENSEKLGVTLTELSPKIDVSPEVQAATEAFNAQKQVITDTIDVQKRLGKSYNENAARMQNHQTLLDKLIKDGYEENKEKIGELIGSMNLLNTSLFSVEEIGRGVTKSLANIAAQEAVLGDAFDSDAAKVRIYQTALIALRILGLEPGMVAFDEYMKKLEEAGEAQHQLGISAEQMTSMIRQGFFNMAVGVAESFADIITGEIKFKGFLTNILLIVADFMTMFGKALIAAALASEAFRKLLKHPWTAFAAGAALILAAKVVRNILMKGPANMKKGGTIPPGFPNDTFPAMLTSGEKVIPLGADIGSNKVEVNVTVEGVQRGEDLYYIIKEIERKLNNSYG